MGDAGAREADLGASGQAERAHAEPGHRDYKAVDEVAEALAPALDLGSSAGGIFQAMNAFARELRRHRGRLTQRQAATILGVTLTAIQNYEQGRRLPPKLSAVITLEDLESKFPLLDRRQPA